jgi:hypothetical protein
MMQIYKLAQTFVGEGVRSLPPARECAIHLPHTR